MGDLSSNKQIASGLVRWAAILTRRIRSISALGCLSSHGRRFMSVYDWQEDERWLQKCLDKCEALSLKRQLFEGRRKLEEARGQTNQAASKLHHWQAELQKCQSLSAMRKDSEIRQGILLLLFILVSLPCFFFFFYHPEYIKKRGRLYFSDALFVMLKLSLLELFICAPLLGMVIEGAMLHRQTENRENAAREAQRAEDRLRSIERSEASHLNSLRSAREGLEVLRARYAWDRWMREALEEPWVESRDLVQLLAILVCTPSFLILDCFGNGMMRHVSWCHLPEPRWPKGKAEHEANWQRHPNAAMKSYLWSLKMCYAPKRLQLATIRILSLTSNERFQLSTCET